MQIKVLRGKFAVLKAYFRKQERSKKINKQRSKISNLRFCLKKPETEEQSKTKLSRRKEELKTEVEINEIENIKTI